MSNFIFPDTCKKETIETLPIKSISELSKGDILNIKGNTSKEAFTNVNLKPLSRVERFKHVNEELYNILTGSSYADLYTKHKKYFTYKQLTKSGEVSKDFNFDITQPVLSTIEESLHLDVIINITIKDNTVDLELPSKNQTHTFTIDKELFMHLVLPYSILERTSMRARYSEDKEKVDRGDYVEFGFFHYADNVLKKTENIKLKGMRKMLTNLKTICDIGIPPVIALNSSIYVDEESSSDSNNFNYITLLLYVKTERVKELLKTHDNVTSINSILNLTAYKEHDNGYTSMIVTTRSYSIFLAISKDERILNKQLFSNVFKCELYKEFVKYVSDTMAFIEEIKV